MLKKKKEQKSKTFIGLQRKKKASICTYMKMCLVGFDNSELYCQGRNISSSREETFTLQKGRRKKRLFILLRDAGVCTCFGGEGDPSFHADGEVK